VGGKAQQADGMRGAACSTREIAMSGKFLRREAIIDTVKSEQRTNAIRKRHGKTRHPVTVTSCGCPDPNCGAFHIIRTERAIPTAAEAVALLAAHKKTRKATISKKKAKRQ
jgi:hypothetical protein